MAGSFKWATALLFTLSVFMPLTQQNLFLFREEGSTEKRRLAERPRLDLKNLRNFPEKYELYFNDNFGFRNRLIAFNNRLDMYYDKLSPAADPAIKIAIVGKEGWLFYNPLYRATYEATEFSREELKKIRAYIEKEDEIVRAAGGRLLVIIAPNKNSVYPEYLPQWLPLEKQNAIDQVLDYMKTHSSFEMIDLRKPFLDAKADHLLYYKTDTHWNDHGAFVAYGEIMKRLKAGLPEAHVLSASDYDVSWGPKKDAGDLARMLSLPGDFKDEEARFKLKKGAEPKNKIPKILIFGDSFFDALGPFFANDFENQKNTGSRILNNDMIREEKAGVVIMELVERKIKACLLDRYGQ